MIYYGLLSWRRRPAPEAGRSFSYHRAGSYAAIVSALLIVSADCSGLARQCIPVAAW